jgi:hypothetical protein
VKAADNSINKEAREALVEGFSKALTSHIPCLNPDRYTNLSNLCCADATLDSSKEKHYTLIGSQPV